MQLFVERVQQDANLWPQAGLPWQAACRRFDFHEHVVQVSGRREDTLRTGEGVYAARHKA
jgi:hypothetical protein